MLNIRYLFSSDKDWLRYGLCSSVWALFVGLYGYSVPIAASHIYFFLATPFAAFIACSLIWKWTFRPGEKYRVLDVATVSLISTALAHFLTFVILDAAGKTCYFLTGNCTDYSGGNTYSFIFDSLLQAFVSTQVIGVVTFPLGFITALYVMKTSVQNKHEK
jgi:ABC-type phosphate transport system permease subunit